MKKRVLGAILVLAFLIMGSLGRVLVVNEPLKKVDVIVVYSGDSGERTVKGVELLKAGYADYIIFSGGALYDDVRMADLMTDHALKLDVEIEKIIKEREASTTHENALFVKDILLERQFKSAILVTSNYHSRRSQLTTKKVLKGSDIELVTVSSNDEFNKNWWKDGRSVLICINEYAKILGYYFKGRI
ncbi:YdcF family protein [Cetobacterium sp.]|uniref:YdcF family protein n=1 Tax=Cetobacterium sp. TaxID=2071632 RepID=UPI003EE61C42